MPTNQGKSANIAKNPTTMKRSVFETLTTQKKIEGKTRGSSY
jgi:hypothetical protein